MRKFHIVFFFIIIFVGSLLLSSVAYAESNVYVQYHLWFTKEDPQLGSQKIWYGWSKKTWGATNANDPTSFLSPWRRDYSSRIGLPLVGVYSSNFNPGAVRYMFELAKKAGINGLFASNYSWGYWNPIVAKHLAIAREVGVPLGIEIYVGYVDSPDRPAGYKAIPMQSNGCVVSRKFQVKYLVNNLKPFKNDPGYLRIDGRPVVWITNYVASASEWTSTFRGTDCSARQFYHWGTVAEMKQLFTTIEQELGEPFYVVMSGPTIDSEGQSYSTVPQIWRITTSENISTFYQKFGSSNQITRLLNAQDRNIYEEEMQYAFNRSKDEANGKFAFHVYPAFDERGPFSFAGRPGVGLPRQVITRSGNVMFPNAEGDGFLRYALNLAKTNNTDVFLESWNDWNESTQIEPGFHFNNYVQHKNYFSALKAVADYKGITNPNFHFPPLSAVDPPILQYCRYKEWSGGRVRLRGKLGFGKQATATNGVRFEISYQEDDVSSVDPSYLPGTRWDIGYSTTELYNGSLQTFDIDLTPYLDKPGLVIGIEDNGDTTSDQIFFPELILDWYGQPIDLVQDNALRTFHWHSGSGNITFPQSAVSGSVNLETNVLLEDNQTYPKALYIHPNYDNAPGKFVHGGFNFFGLAAFITQCIPADYDNNGIIDWNTFFKRYSQADSQQEGDVDKNGKINSLDFREVRLFSPLSW